MDTNATARAIQTQGRLAILRRSLGQNRGRQDVELKILLTAYQPIEMTNNIAQGDQKGVICNLEIAEKRWPGPPKRGDSVLMQDGSSRVLTVEAVETRDLDGIPVRHNLQLRGS